MAEIKIYHKPTCATSRKGLKYLEEKGVDFEIVKFFDTPFTKTKLKSLIKKTGMKAEELLRTRDKQYKELDFKNKKYTQAQIIDFMLANPNLIERPIVERGDKAVLAKPPEKIEELF